MSRRAIIDGDILVHRAVAVATTMINVNHRDVESGVFTVEPGESIKAISRQHAREELARLVDQWDRDAGGDGNPLIALSDRRRPDSTFRYAIYPGYKANRGGGTKHPAWWEIHNTLVEDYDSLWHPGLEGDDVIGLTVSRAPKRWTSVSNDKDMKTIPGYHYNTDTGKVLEVTPKFADWFWMWQTITGDKTDNYPGCPGVGPRRAAEYIGDLDNPYDHLGLEGLWPRVLSAYEEYQFETRWRDLWPAELTTTEFAIQQAWCARILRWGDYKRKKVRLWHPDGDFKFLDYSNEETA